MVIKKTSLKEAQHHTDTFFLRCHHQKPKIYSQKSDINILKENMNILNN